ncbi:MAG: nucleotidyltransferase family protein, partial [Candidatus Binatia bacterium]
APAFAIDEAAMWRTTLDVSIDGIDVRTLSDEYTLVSLVLAAFEDLGQGLEKLKQLLDLYLLLRAMDGTTDWEAFFARRAPENLVAVTANVLALCADLFEARDELARLSAALERRRGLCALAGRDEVLHLVAAPPKHRANLVWFGRVYPGSLVHYLLWFWAFGLPDNLVRLGPTWLRSQLGVVADAARAQRVRRARR